MRTSLTAGGWVAGKSAVAVPLPVSRRSLRPVVCEFLLLVALVVLPLAGSAFGEGQIGSPLALEVGAKVFAVLLLLGLALLLGADKLPASRPWWILMLLSGFFLVASPWAVSPSVSVPDAALLLGASLLVGMLGVAIGALGVLRAVAGAASLLVLASFVTERWVESSSENVLGGDGLFGFDRVAGAFSDPNMFGQTAAAGVLAAALLLTHQRRVGVAAVCGALCLVGLAASQSRTAVVALAVALFVAAVRTQRARLLSVVGLLIVVVFLAALPGIGSFGTESLTRSGDANEVATLTGRTRVWQAVVEVVPDRPVIGHGAGSSPEVLSERIREGRISWPALHAHNGLLQVLLTGGVAGLALLLAAFAAWFGRKRPEPRLDALVWLVIVGTATEVLVMRSPSTYWLVLVAVFAVGGTTAGYHSAPVSTTR